MTEHAIARNAAAIRNLAATLDSWGLGDAHNRAEHIARRLTADGYRPVEAVPPLRPDRAELGGDGYREFVEAKENLANRQKEAH